jgi:hypothetical protein
MSCGSRGRTSRLSVAWAPLGPPAGSVVAELIEKSDGVAVVTLAGRSGSTPTGAAMMAELVGLDQTPERSPEWAAVGSS